MSAEHERKRPGSSRFRQSIFALICLGAGLVFSLVLAEATLRTNLFAPSFEMNGLTFVLEPALLYKLRPHSRSDLNAMGLRGPEFNPEHSEKKRVLFMGDSFVFGVNVPEPKSMPHVLGDLLGRGYEVINAGVQGYGPDQSLVQFMNSGLKWKPDAVILSLYPTNDFADIEKNRLFDVRGEELVPVSPTLVAPFFPEWRLGLWLRLFRHRAAEADPFRKKDVFYDPLDPSSYMDLFYTFFDDVMDIDFLDAPDSAKAQKKRAVMKAVLKKFRDELSRRNIPFLVVIIPTGENIQDAGPFRAMKVPETRYFFNEEAARGVCEELGIDHVNLYKMFLPRTGQIEFFDLKDGHLSERGYEYVARFLSLWVRAQERARKIA